MGNRAEFTFDVSGGENTFLPPRVLKPSQCAKWINFNPAYSYGSAFSRKGRSLYLTAKGSPTGTRLNGYYRYVLSSGTVHHVGAEGTALDVITSGGSTWTSIKGSLAIADNKVSFAELNDILYIAYGGGRLAQWTGTGDAALLADTNAPTGKVVALWNGRIVGVDGTSTVKGSAALNGDDFTTVADAFSETFDPNDGSSILALVPYKAGLLVCKGSSIHVLTGFSWADLEQQRLLQNEGIIHERAWAVWKEFPIIATRTGIWHITHDTQTITNFALGFLREYRDTIAGSGKVVLGVHNDVLYVSWDSDADGRVDSTKAIDLYSGRVSTWTNQPISLYEVLQDGTFVAGTDNTRAAVMKLLDTYEDEGTPIAVTLRSKAFVFADLPLLRSSIDEVRVMVRRTTGARTMTIKSIINDLTTTTLNPTAEDVQNVSGGDYRIYPYGSQLADESVSFAVQIESTGSGEFEICGIGVVGDIAEMP
jgi:hypothetical protein